MQPQCDDSSFDWIRRGRRESMMRTDPGWAGNCVSNLMPGEFGGYVKVLHTVTARYDLIDNPLTPEERSRLSIPACDKLRSLVEVHRGEIESPRVRWKEVASLLNVPFAPEICHAWYRRRLDEGCWPRLLYGPTDGVLDLQERSALVSILKQFVGSGGCFYRFPEIPAIGTDKPLLFHGKLDELEELMESGPNQYGPEYWWPSDQSWCVCSDFDLMFTVVGGPRELVSRLLKDDVLECIEVTAQTRIDDFVSLPEH